MIGCQLQRLLVAARADGAQDRAKDLLLVDVHVGRHLVEQVRADEEAILIALEIEIAAIDNQFRALIHTGLHQPQNALLGLRRHDRAVIDIVF